MAKSYFPRPYIDVLENLSNPLVQDYALDILDKRRDYLDRDIDRRCRDEHSDLTNKTHEVIRIICHYLSAKTPQEIETAKQMVREAIEREC